MTIRQRLFVHYLLGESAGNATDAARRAGYRKPKQQATENLAKPAIREAIEARVSAVAMSQDEILARLSEIASGSLLEFLEGDDGESIKVDLKRARKRGLGPLVKRLKAKDGTVEVELRDSLKALELLGRFHGMWDRPVSQAPDAVKAMRAALDAIEATGRPAPEALAPQAKGPPDATRDDPGA